MATVIVNAGKIVDWDSFHDAFQRAFRFFAGYGRNGDAWIDCMTNLHGPNSLSELSLPPGESIEIVLKDVAALRQSHLEIHRGLLALVEAANSRYAETDDSARITLLGG